jgi:hypothetical protein
VYGEPSDQVDVSAWEVVRAETSGRDEKYWLRDPNTGKDWLFKAVTVKQGHVHGEDWAEKAVSHLADLVGIPHARIELARRGESHGLIALNLTPRSFELQEGRVLLQRFPEYVHQPRRGGEHPGYSLENIQIILEGALPPPGWEAPFDATAFDVFAGYLVLDAWVANTDRHENNWAVLRHVGDPELYLCGSYDHASSLGWNVLDDDRTARLAEAGRVEQWCERGIASCFERLRRQPRLTLVALAKRALDLASPAAMEHWPAMLAQVTEDAMKDALARIAGMSDPARIFALRVLETNRRRVLDACG